VLAVRSASARIACRGESGDDSRLITLPRPSSRATASVRSVDASIRDNNFVGNIQRLAGRMNRAEGFWQKQFFVMRRDDDMRSSENSFDFK